ARARCPDPRSPGATRLDLAGVPGASSHPASPFQGRRRQTISRAVTIADFRVKLAGNALRLPELCLCREDPVG
ncbi:MAG: hypothetical protein ACYDB7_12050, partial [Mycobacteriales bacterium]